MKAIRCISLVAAAVSLFLAATAHSAIAAASTPTPQVIINQCGTTGVTCVFHASGPVTTKFLKGKPEGSNLYNCTRSEQTYDDEFGYTSETSFTIGGSVTLTVGVEFVAVFEASVEASYDHTWTTSYTYSNQPYLTVESGQVGWVDYGPEVSVASGDWEVTFSDPFYGQTKYFVQNFKGTGPLQPVPPVANQKDPMSSTDIIDNARKMTKAEVKGHCPGGKIGS